MEGLMRPSRNSSHPSSCAAVDAMTKPARALPQDWQSDQEELLELLPSNWQQLPSHSHSPRIILLMSFPLNQTNNTHLLSQLYCTSYFLHFVSPAPTRLLQTIPRLLNLRPPLSPSRFPSPITHRSPAHPSSLNYLTPYSTVITEIHPP
jgi:hypothetical protein